MSELEAVEVEEVAPLEPTMREGMFYWSYTLGASDSVRNFAIEEMHVNISTRRWDENVEVRVWGMNAFKVRVEFKSPEHLNIEHLHRQNDLICSVETWRWTQKNLHRVREYVPADLTIVVRR